MKGSAWCFLSKGSRSSVITKESSCRWLSAAAASLFLFPCFLHFITSLILYHRVLICFLVSQFSKNSMNETPFWQNLQSSAFEVHQISIHKIQVLFEFGFLVPSIPYQSHETTIDILCPNCQVFIVLKLALLWAIWSILLSYTNGESYTSCPRKDVQMLTIHLVVYFKILFPNNACNSQPLILLHCFCKSTCISVCLCS